MDAGLGWLLAGLAWLGFGLALLALGLFYDSLVTSSEFTGEEFPKGIHRFLILFWPFLSLLAALLACWLAYWPYLASIGFPGWNRFLFAQHPIAARCGAAQATYTSNS